MGRTGGLTRSRGPFGDAVGNPEWACSYCLKTAFANGKALVMLTGNLHRTDLGALTTAGTF